MELRPAGDDLVKPDGIRKGSGENRVLVGHIKKYKIADKNSALDKAAKTLGMYAIDNSQKTDPLAALLHTIPDQKRQCNRAAFRAQQQLHSCGHVDAVRDDSPAALRQWAQAKELSMIGSPYSTHAIDHSAPDWRL